MQYSLNVYAINNSALLSPKYDEVSLDVSMHGFEKLRTKLLKMVWMCVHTVNKTTNTSHNTAPKRGSRSTRWMTPNNFMCRFHIVTNTNEQMYAQNEIRSICWISIAARSTAPFILRHSHITNPKQPSTKYRPHHSIIHKPASSFRYHFCASIRIVYNISTENSMKSILAFKPTIQDNLCRTLSNEVPKHERMWANNNKKLARNRNVYARNHTHAHTKRKNISHAS